MTLYRVFVRNWWRKEYFPSRIFAGRSNDYRLVPNPGARKTTLARGVTETEARAICERWNTTHEPGVLSRKAEYTRED